MTLLPQGARDLREFTERLERGIQLRAIGEAPKGKPDYITLYCMKDGAGKTQLIVQHPTGAPVVLTTEL